MEKELEKLGLIKDPKQKVEIWSSAKSIQVFIGFT